MAKDRFSNQKPINWNTEWKKTGNKGNRYNTLEKKDAYDAFKANEELKESIRIKKLAFEPPQAKPKKELKTPEFINKLRESLKQFSGYMTEWEIEFIKSLLSTPYALSDKQKKVMDNIKNNVRRKLILAENQF